MIDKNIIKSEIDKVPSKYLEILYRIIKSLESDISNQDNKKSKIKSKEFSWEKFISDTYGSLSPTPIERPHQGEYEIRDKIQ